MLNFWFYRGQTGKNDSDFAGNGLKMIINTMKIIWDASLLWLRNKNGQPMDTNFLTA